MSTVDDAGRRDAGRPRSPRSPTPPSSPPNSTGCWSPARVRAGWPVATSSRSATWATQTKTARTFPTIDGVRWSVPGDRANVLDDGRIELLGRDSVTINSGGEKIFVEEVERAVAAHPGVYDVVVVGRPSERWGSEVVAVVQFADGASRHRRGTRRGLPAQSIARYKMPKAFIRTAEDRALASRQGRLPLGQGSGGRARRSE